MTKNFITASTIHGIFLSLIQTAAAMAMEEGLKKEDWIIDRITQQVEDNDQLILPIKAYVDLPWVDDLQAKGIRFLVQMGVRKAYSYAQAHNLLPAKTLKNPPADELTEEERRVAEQLGVNPDNLVKGVPTTTGANPLADLPPPPPAAEPLPSEVPGPSAAPTPNADDTDEPGQEGSDEPDYEALVEGYVKGGGWYEFPADPEGEDKETPVKKQGREAAVEYLKTRDDLVYEDAEEPTEENTNPNTN